MNWRKNHRGLRELIIGRFWYYESLGKFHEGDMWVLPFGMGKIYLTTKTFIYLRRSGKSYHLTKIVGSSQKTS